MWFLMKIDPPVSDHIKNAPISKKNDWFIENISFIENCIFCFLSLYWHDFSNKNYDAKHYLIKSQIDIWFHHCNLIISFSKLKQKLIMIIVISLKYSYSFLSKLKRMFFLNHHSFYIFIFFSSHQLDFSLINLWALSFWLQVFIVMLRVLQSSIRLA